MSAIVACCSKAGLAVIRALGAHQVPIAALSFGAHQVAARSRFVKTLHACPDPSENEEGFVEAALALGSEWDGAAFIPTDDGALAATARHYQRLAARFRPVCHDWDVVGALIEKHHTYRIAGECGVPCPRLQLVSSLSETLEFAAQIGFPCLLKPSVSHLFFKKYRRKMFMVREEAELLAFSREALGYGGEVMLCEYIPGGDECGVNYNSFALEGSPIAEFTAAKVRNKPTLIGFPTVVRSIVLPEVRELGRRMLKALNLTDFSCMEFKRDPRTGDYKLMEVNGRHNYSGALAVACGLNFPMFSYSRVLGRTLPQAPGAQEEDVYWIDEERDARDVVRGLLRGRTRVIEPYRKRKVFSVFRQDDPRPFLDLASASVSQLLKRTNARPVEHSHAAMAPLQAQPRGERDGERL